ncbi:MAG: Gfo/Idh/MocA family oxidoreductase [Bacteroidales bacterium]|jgi:predicted dehydrogenase
MRFLIIGLGSMGKRRIRCLKALGFNDIIGFDPRIDRIDESNAKYKIEITNNFNSIDLKKINAFIISTPPDKHTDYINIAIQNKKPAFVEASVVIEGLEELNKTAKSEQIFIAPSCTLQFHPLIKEIKKTVNSNKYGKVTNFTYHSGNFLPDWHPWEKVSDFYVSNRKTGGAREIVPFELTWICDILGMPNDIKGFFLKTTNVGADIEDTYAFTTKYNSYAGSIIVDVVSRYSIRNLILNMENGQIIWRWDNSYFDLYEVEQKKWLRFNQPEGKAEAGYNKNIIEEMYIDEISSFINHLNTKSIFPNSLDKDIEILKLLNKIEKSDGGF